MTPAPGATDSACVSAGLTQCFQTIVGYPANTTPVSAANNEFQSTGIYQTTLAADHTHSLYMTMVYFVTLSRDPDPSGFSFWLGIANQGFIGSSGFQELFAN